MSLDEYVSMCWGVQGRQSAALEAFKVPLHIKISYGTYLY